MEELDFIFWVLLIGGSIYMVVSFFNLVITGWWDIEKQSKARKLINIQLCKTKKLGVLSKIGLWETIEFKWEKDLASSLEGRLIVINMCMITKLNMKRA